MRLHLRSLLAAVAMLLSAQSVGHALDLIFVSMSDDTIASFDISSGNATTIAASKTTFASGLNEPQGLAFDSNNQLFVANLGNNTVSKITSGGVVSQFASGFNNPIGLAIDSLNNIYVANSGNNTVSRINSSGTVITFANGLSNPTGLAVASDDSLFVANDDSGGIINQIAPGIGVSTYAVTNGSLTGLAFSSGILYSSDSRSSSISTITSGGTVSPFVSSGLSTPMGLTVDAGGNLYVANYVSASISKYDNTGSLLFSFSTGSASPTYLTFASVQVPEPSTYALAAIATGVITAIARRRKVGRA